jgi:hypothetical protein
VLGREAAATLPLEPLFGPAVRPSWGWQAAAVTRALRGVEPIMARNGRVVLLLEGDGPESLVACVLGGVGADYRLAGARLPEAGARRAASSSWSRPAPARCRAAPGPARTSRCRRSRAAPATRHRARRAPAPPLPRRVPLNAELTDPVDCGTYTRDRMVFDTEATMSVPAYLLIPNDRRRPGPAVLAIHGHGPGKDEIVGIDAGSPHRTEPAGDHVERLLTIVRDALAETDGRRLVRVGEDRWWLGERADREAAAAPLADRVEWAVYSLLSTAGPLSESAFLDRIAGLFIGPDSRTRPWSGPASTAIAASPARRTTWSRPTT